MENPDYVQFSSYWNDIIVTGLLPLILLCYMNLRVFVKIKVNINTYKFIYCIFNVFSLDYWINISSTVHCQFYLPNGQQIKGQLISEHIYAVLNLKFEMKMTKIYLKILLMKSSRNNFIFLPVFYLIMCLMKAPKNFEKIVILKIWELMRCQNSLRQTSPKILHLKMTVWISVLWRIYM